ncbi:MAG TPA: hypothetical protein DCL93_00195 [Faecalibacterium sp.]|nr:hypothetical protein [Faecalibacterium sp.]
MKKWLIRCLTVLAMVCLIPGIALNAKAVANAFTYCIQCKADKTCDILGYVWQSNADPIYHKIRIKCRTCRTENEIIYKPFSYHTGGTETPTCTTGKICRLCWSEYGILGHDWGAWRPNDDGTHTRSCTRSNCDAVENESCSGGTGTFTCTTGKTCEKCGAEYGILGHDWGAWTSDGDGTHGTHTRRCTRCDKEETESCSGGATCTSPGVCATCGGSYYGGHDWGEWSSAGNGTHIRNCKNCYKVDTASCTGGTATCTAKAVCEACGGEYGEKDPNNHALVHPSAKAPTCTEIGWDAYDLCVRCGYTTRKELPALNHDLVRHVAQAPTCTEKGWAYDTCSRCGYTTYAELPALNHDYQAVTVEPTCETDGYTIFTCSRCKDSYTADPTDQLGHQFGAWSPNGTGSQSADCLRQGCAHIGSTDCRKFTFHTAEGETLTFCPVCGQTENAAQLEKIEAATAWAASGSLSAEDVTARTNGEYLSVAFETAGSLTQPTGRVRLALPAGLLEGKTLVRIAPDGTQTEMPFETERGKLIYTLDFANSALPVMLFRLVPQTAAL